MSAAGWKAKNRGHLNLLAMLPVQCSTSAMSCDILELIRVREEIPPVPIALIQRSETLLTPAAEYFCDALLREGPQVESGTSKARRSAR